MHHPTQLGESSGLVWRLPQIGPNPQEITLAPSIVLKQITPMGMSHAKIRLENPKRTDLLAMEVDALADTGALFLCIPEEVRLQLQLEATSKKEVTTADGKRVLCPYVGPVRITFENRECYVGAVVLGNEVLLGAVPMEDMDLVVVPSARRVAVNPQHPDFASGLAKGFRQGTGPA